MVRSWIQDIKGSGIRINVLSAGAVDDVSEECSGVSVRSR